MKRAAFTILAALIVAGGCTHGGAEARRDITRNHLELREWGEGYASEKDYARLLKERLGVEYRHVGGCVGNHKEWRSNDAYNSVMTAEIKQRFGPTVLDELQKEASAEFAVRLQTGDVPN